MALSACWILTGCAYRLSRHTRPPILSRSEIIPASLASIASPASTSRVQTLIHSQGQSHGVFVILLLHCRSSHCISCEPVLVIHRVYCPLLIVKPLALDCPSGGELQYQRSPVCLVLSSSSASPCSSSFICISSSPESAVRNLGSNSSISCRSRVVLVKARLRDR